MWVAAPICSCSSGLQLPQGTLVPLLLSCLSHAYVSPQWLQAELCGQSSQGLVCQGSWGGWGLLRGDAWV